MKNILFTIVFLKYVKLTVMDNYIVNVLRILRF